MGMRLEKSGELVVQSFEKRGYLQTIDQKDNRKNSFIYWLLLLVFVLYTVLSYVIGA